MYIQPNSIIKIYNNVPLDDTYNHTLYFESIEKQNKYFHQDTRAKFILNNQSYQRVVKGTMRVELSAESLYDCDYLAFKNASFGDKWFYAFILSVEYVNNSTSEITFEIDSFQTYLFDVEVQECFVEREHSASDKIGDNLVDEGIDTGEYITDDFDGSGYLGAKSIVVAATFDENYNEVDGSMYGGIYSGIAYTSFPHSIDGAVSASAFIQGASSRGKANEIVAVFIMPTRFITGRLESVKDYTITKNKNVTSIDGIVPKNKKLLTYPYNFLYVTNLQGGHAVFPYEYFNSNTCDFIITGDMTCDPHVVLAPLNYKGATVNYDEKLVLGGYPQCSYNIDTFKMWLTQNAVNIGLGLIGGAIPKETTVGKTYPAHEVSNNFTGITSILSQAYQHVIAPNQACGQMGNSTLCAVGILDFAFMHKHIRKEYVEIIDDYFNMFGYATKRVKIPNTNVRPHWTYTKTRGCVVKGNAPSDDISKICDIYNNGITFWKKADEVGNYSLNNSPIIV